MSSISFDNVWLLFIALPLAVVLTVPFLLAVRKDNRNGHNIASMVLHAVMAVVIAFAAAGTQIVTVATETDVYVVADVSYSANKNLDTIDSYIQNIALPKNSKLGVITFGKDYKLHTALGKKVGSVRNSGVDDSETNIVEALEYAATLFKDNVVKRIVLITDGKQTYGDSGELRRAVTNLQAQGIHVDAMYIDDNIPSDAREVQISSADYTRNTYLDRTETVDFTLMSSFQTNAKVTLYKDGEQYKTFVKTLDNGVNVVSFELYTEESGTYEYKAVVEAADDESDLNNSYTFEQTVSGAVNVLFIGGNESELDSVRALYGESAGIDSYAGEKSVPVGVEELCKYDEIVLSEIDISELDNYEMLMSSLDTVVSSFGKTLITLGNMAVQDKTEGELKALDDMLPVRYGDALDNPKLYTIVLDVSASMQIWSRMILARQVAAQLIGMLSDDDYVCIVAFSGDVEVVLPPVSLADRDAVLQVLQGLSFEQGTLVGLGLNKALETIRNLDFSEKRVMLITDGLTYDSFPDKSKEQDSNYAVETMRAYGIQTSVVAVGGGNDNRGWLENLATIGGGRYYLVETEASLPAIMFGDISQDLNDKIINSSSWISKIKPRDEVLNEVDMDEAYVSRFVVSKTKSSATNVLSVSYKVSTSSENITVEVPLYAYWNYGNGKVASYTGSLNGMKKYGDTIASELNAAFFGNLFATCVPSEKMDYPFSISTEMTGKSVRVSLNPAQLQSGASATASIITPSGERLEDRLVFDSSSYYYDFVAPDVGKYFVTVAYSYGTQIYEADAGFIISYEPEYDAFAVYEASILYKMLGGEGIVSENGNLTLVNDEKEVETYCLHLTLPLLVLAVVLYVADIVIRKLKWNDIVSLFGKVKKKNAGGAK